MNIKEYFFLQTKFRCTSNKFNICGQCLMVSLSHSFCDLFSSVDKETTEELLKAIQRKSVTLDTLRYNPLPPCSSPPAPSVGESHFAKHTHTPNGMYAKRNFFSKVIQIYFWWLISSSTVPIKRTSVPRLSQPLPSLFTQTEASPAERHVEILCGHTHGPRASTFGSSWKGWIHGVKPEAPGPPEQLPCFSPEERAQSCTEWSESALGEVHTRVLCSTLPPGCAAVYAQHAAEQRLDTQLPQGRRQLIVNF